MPKARWLRRSDPRTRLGKAILVTGVAGVLGTAGMSPANAVPIDPTDNPCMSNSTATLSVSPQSVTVGQAVTFTSSVSKAPGCSFSTQLVFHDSVTGRSFTVGGSKPVTPPATGTYVLQAVSQGRLYDMASAWVTATLPVVNGRPLAAVTRGGDQAALFAMGARTENALVVIAPDVDLDLSYMNELPVKAGVTIVGQHDAAHPAGPRILTTTYPGRLLMIGDPGPQTTADGVRITGVRFDGQEGEPCDEAGDGEDDSDAISVFSSVNVQIDHNEFTRWRGSAVDVRDPINRLDRTHPDTVRLNDNHFHDNQHPTYCGVNPLGSEHGGGYGVNVAGGAYAYIDRNVFDRNRHAVASNGNNGDGYTIARNLFLSPGINSEKLSVTTYNHQIDVHGQKSCPGVIFEGEHYNCGPAGEYFDVEYNTVAVGLSAAIQLRGTPTSWTDDPSTGGMRVLHNTFVQDRDDALTQTEEGLVDAGANRFGDLDYLQSAFFGGGKIDLSTSKCDFDGDGVADAYRDSKVTTWYFSSRINRWVYFGLTPSQSVAFSDTNGDKLCDVVLSGGAVRVTQEFYPTDLPLTAQVPLVVGLSQAAAADALGTHGFAVGTVTTQPSTAPAGTVLGGVTGPTAPLGTVFNLVVSTGGKSVPRLTGKLQGAAASALTEVGLALGSVATRVDPAAPQTVVAQDRAPDTVVLPGTAVNITVSLGQTIVPDVRGDTAAEARSELQAAGLPATTRTVRSCVDPDRVGSQDPPAGAAVAPGTTVQIDVAQCTGNGGGNPVHPL